MAVGDKKTIEIPAQDAYGPEDPQMIMDFPVSQFPENLKPEIGMQISLNNGAGQRFPAVITEINGDTVVLDANHPLAGEDLIFDLELVEIIGVSRIIMP
jgi:peptidylprolyl isomerase